MTTIDAAHEAADAQVDTAMSSPVRATGARRAKVTTLFAALVVAIVVVSLVSASVGQYGIGFGDVAASVAHKVFGPLGVGHASADHFAEATLWQVRMPRVAMSLMVGAALACSGALMQGVFGNPLADPGIVGVSSGAAVGAAAVIAGGINLLGEFTVPAAAFVTGLIAALVVYSLSRAHGRTEVVTLVLTGIAVNAVAGAGLAFCTFFGSQVARDQIVFWQLGSLNGSRWPYVVTVAPLAAFGIVAACAMARRLDLLALGDRSARHLGVDVERLRLGAAMRVLGAGVKVQRAHLRPAEGAARDHPLDSLLQHALRKAAFEHLVGGDLFQAAGITGVLVISLGLELVAGETDLVGVDHDDMVTAIDVRGEARLVLAAQEIGDDHRESADDEAVGIDQVPFLVDLGRLDRPGLLAEGLHGSSLLMKTIGHDRFEAVARSGAFVREGR